MKTVIFALVFAFCLKILIIFADDEKSYRLPNGKISVESYNVKIIPDLKNNFDFEGKVSVIMTILEDMKCITMNSKDLIMKNVEFKAYDGVSNREIFYRLREDEEMLELCFSKILRQYTPLQIIISFGGKMRDDFRGLYKVQYEENGSKKWLAATLLEPTYARMVFPCFDEPQYSAKFSLSLARYPDQKSLSITSLQSTSSKDPQIDNRVWDIFQNTVLCAPYLMSFAVHSFTSRTEKKGHLTIYSRKHTDNDVEFVKLYYRDWFTKVNEYLNTYGYFDPYIDIVALPDGNEFSQKGTMMIYKEKDVLQIEGVDMTKHKEEIAKASIHKIYHLWMGGYVRPLWWDDTWLIESFGIYFQYIIANQVHPLWKMKDRFVIEVLQEALFEEEMFPENSVVSSLTKPPSEIQAQKFNSFINKKGASILNMLQQLIGNDFQKGFKNALGKANDEKSEIKPNDLWAEIDRAIALKNLLPKNTLVKRFMESWFQSSGYPLITVLNNECGEVVIKQETFRSPATTYEIPEHNWIVPITCKKKSSTFENEDVIWLHDSESVTVNYHLNKDEWVLCNLKQGYYRVSYSKENWNLLIDQLKSQPANIDNLARAQLLDDSFHLAIHKKLSFSTALNLGTYLEKETDMLPWFSIIKYITHLLTLYENTTVNEYFKRYFLDLIKHQFNRIGFGARKDDSYMTEIGRPYILSIACQLGLADCLANSARIYNTYINDLAKIPAELKYVVYCSSFKILKDEHAAWDKLWAMYKNSQTMSEKELLLSSLACVNDEILLRKYLKMTIDPEEFTLFQYEKECIIKSTAKSYKGVMVILDVINELIPKLESLSEKTKQTLLSMAKEIHFNIVSSEQVEKTKQVTTRMGNYNEKNADLLNSLKKSIDLGTKKVDLKAENAHEVKEAIRDIIGDDDPIITDHPSMSSSSTQTHVSSTNSMQSTTDPTYVPSSDNRVTPLITKYSIIIIGLFFFII